MAAWLPQPVMFDSSHAFDCEGFTSEQCRYYKERWHNWYVADWTFALPTVAFFMCTIGIFIVGYAITQMRASSGRSGSSLWTRGLAATRYLSYRGFHLKGLRWNSAPIGILLLGAVGTIFFFCMDLAPSPYYWPGTDMVWGNSPPLGTRSGWLSLACMPFVFATASKTNWITLVTGVTHEKLQIFHRWISYAFFILALMHTFPFIVWHIRNHDMVYQVTVSNIFEYWTGIVALIFQAWLTFASWGPSRNLGYEFFKAAHFFSAVVFMLIFFWHCDGTLTSWHYFVATAAVYVPCLAYPWLRTIFEYGISQKAQIFVEDNGFIRINIPATFKWQPGQHCFLRFPGFGIHALSSHPFTICSLPSTSPKKPAEIFFYIRRRGGFTTTLHDYAIQRPGMLTPVLVDGPYGGIDNQKYFSSERLIVVAGGSGAGWMLPFIEQYLRYLSKNTSQEPQAEETHKDKEASDEPPHQQANRGPHSLQVILATRDMASRAWFYTALNKLLLDYKLQGTPSEIRVQVHLTGKAERIVHSPTTRTSDDLEGSDSPSSGEAATEKLTGGEYKKLDADNIPEEEIRGRPDLPSIIRDEAAASASTGQTVGIFVCGPLTMQHDVRNAVATANLGIVKSPRSGGMYLHLEHFSWA